MNPLEAAIAEEEKKLNQLMNEGEDNDDDAGASEGDGSQEENEGEGSQGEGDSKGGDEGDESGAGEGKSDGYGITQKGGDESRNDEKEGEVVPKDAAAWARMRREARELKARLASLESSPKRVEEPVRKEISEGDPEPNKAESYQDWLEWKIRQQDKVLGSVSETLAKRQREEEYNYLYNQAIHELKGYTDAYKKRVPDFDNAANFVAEKIKGSLRVLNPGMSDEKAQEETVRMLVKEASAAVLKGLDPAEELYGLAFERYGYQPQSQEKAKAPERQQKPDLKVIQGNKKRSASPLHGGGHTSGGTLTPEAVATMTNAEFSRLTPSQLAEIESMEA